MKKWFSWLILLSILSLCQWAGADTSGTGDIDQGLWLGSTSTTQYIVQQARDGDQPILKIGLRRNSEPVKWDERLGKAKSIVTMGNSLFVAFNDGLIVRFTEQAAQVILRRLPEGAFPERLFADSSRNRLFVLARRIQSAANSTSAPSPATSAASNAGGAWQVFELTNGQWTALPPLPKGIDALTRPILRLWADRGQVEFVVNGLTSVGTQWFRWTLNKDRWAEQKTVGKVHASIDDFWPLTLDGKPVIVASQPQSSGKVLMIFPMMKFDKTAGIGPLSRDGAVVVLKDKFFVAAETDRIVVGQLFDNGTGIKLARWTDQGTPVGSWETIGQPDSPRRQDHSVLVTMAMVALLLSVFFSRVIPVVLSQELPAGLVLAAYWRRGFAFFIDFFMVNFVVVFFLVFFYPSVLRDLPDLETLSRSMQSGQMDNWMYIIGLVITGVFAGYCTVSEARKGTTAGKWLMGLCVRQARNMEGLPTGKQAVVRNAIKVLELCMWFLPITIAMMLLTRSRQRIGDLLAGTVVLQRRTITPENPTE